MAGYASVTDIESEFKGTTFGATDQVSSAEVLAWSDEFSRYVDSIIFTRYSVPVTDANALLILKLIIKNFVSARIKRILNENKIVDDNGIRSTEADKLEKQANAMLKQIVSGEIELFDQSKSGILVANSFNVKTNNPPLIHKNEDQW